MKPFPKNSNSRKPQGNRSNTKKPKIDLAPQREVREMFTNWFKSQRAEAGHVMSKQAVLKNVIKKLDIKQDKVLKNAMDELINNQWITVEEDGVTLVLTEKGALFIKS